MSRFVVIELSADASDNRPLGKDGSFLTGSFGDSDVREFPSPEAARLAAELAPNRRPELELYVPNEKRVPA